MPNLPINIDLELEVVPDSGFDYWHSPFPDHTYWVQKQCKVKPTVINFVQSALGVSGVGASSQTAIFPLSVTSGNSIVVAVATFGVSTVSISDSLGNSYQTVTSSFSGNQACYLYWVISSLGGPCTVTVSVSAASYITVAAHEYTNIANAYGVVSAIGTSSTPAPGTIIISTPGDMAFAFYGQGASVSTSSLVSSPFQRRITQLNGNTNDAIATADSIDGGPVSPVFTITISSLWVAVGAAFSSIPPERDAPSTYQRSQRFEPLPNFNGMPWQQPRRWPIVQMPPAMPPPTRQLSQRFNPLPDLSFNIHEQFRKRQAPSGYFVTQEGYAGIFVPFLTGEAGRAAIANNAVEGYAVYVGVNGMPSFSTPSNFSSTLPVSVSVTPPGSGTETLWVVVRKRDKYGLYSQNQNPTLLVINSSGQLVLPAVLVPTALLLNPSAGGQIRVMAKYATFNNDPYPATQWQVWVDTVTPNTSNPPTLIAPVLAESLVTSLVGPYTPGTYFVSVGLYRSQDSQLGPVLTATVVIPIVPVKPTAVPGGFNTN